MKSSLESWFLKEYIVWNKHRILNPFARCMHSNERLFLKVAWFSDSKYEGLFSTRLYLTEKEYLLALLKEDI